MPELSWDYVGKLAFSALTGGWGGFASLLLASVAALVLYTRFKKTVKEVVHDKVESDREAEQAANPIQNKESEEDHGAAEKEIEDILEDNI